MLRSENVDRQKRAYGKYHCDSNISRHIRTSGKERDQSHHIIDKDEKECRQQIGGKFPVIRTDTAFNNVVIHHHNEHFHESDKSSRSFGSLRTFSVPVRHTQDDYQQQYTIEQ